MIRATISEIGRWFLPHEVDQGRPERILQEADQLDLVSAQFHFFITFESKSNSVFIYENEDVYRWIWPSRGSACTFYRVPRPGQYDKSATDVADIERIQRLRPTTKFISNFSTIFFIIYLLHVEKYANVMQMLSAQLHRTLHSSSPDPNARHR